MSRTSVSPQGLILEKCGSLQALPVLQEGWCYVEDEAAQLVPLLLDVKPGQRVLDTCAAPGGKCSHIAALLQNKGEIVAADPEPRRLKRLESNLDTLGITCVEAVEIAHEADGDTSWFSGQEGFDRILVDAPLFGIRGAPSPSRSEMAEDFRTTRSARGTAVRHSRTRGSLLETGRSLGL